MSVNYSIVTSRCDQVVTQDGNGSDRPELMYPALSNNSLQHCCRDCDAEGDNSALRGDFPFSFCLVMLASECKRTIGFNNNS